jgi:acetyl esterase/lipase
MARLSSKAAGRLVKAIGIKRRLEQAAAVDADPERLAELVAKLRRFDQLEPSRRLQRHWNWESVEVGGYPLHVLESRNGLSRRVILYLHGGGYMFGPFATEWAACHRVAAATDCDFAMLIYPKAPEHQVTETVAVAECAFEVLADRYGAAQVLVMGASAGGGLAIALMAERRDAGRSLPASGILISPGVDMTLAESIGELETGDVMLSTAHVRSAGRLYAGSLGPRHRWVSPAFGELGGLPPLQVFVGTEEILLPSVLTFADRARLAGTEVSLVIGAGQQHTWPLGPTPDGREALADIVEIIGTD